MVMRDRWEVARIIGDCLPREFPQYVVSRMRGAVVNLTKLLSLLLKYNLAALTAEDIREIEEIIHQRAGALIPAGEISCASHGNFSPKDQFQVGHDGMVPIAGLNDRAQSEVAKWWWEVPAHACNLRTHCLRDQWGRYEINDHLDFAGRHYELTWGQVYNVLRDHRQLRQHVLVFVVKDKRGEGHTVTCAWVPSHGWEVLLDEPSRITENAVIISR